MARLIDADVMRDDWLENGENEYVYDTNAVLNSIDSQPTVDAVEVVRCLDCKHSTLPSLVTQRYGVPGTLTCHNHNSPCYKRNVKCEGYCPYGERKEEGRNG